MTLKQIRFEKRTMYIYMCDKCPMARKVDESTRHYYCMEDGRRIPDMGNIPHWCPLRDALPYDYEMQAYDHDLDEYLKKTYELYYEE